MDEQMNDFMRALLFVANVAVATNSFRWAVIKARLGEDMKAAISVTLGLLLLAFAWDFLDRDRQPTRDGTRLLNSERSAQGLIP